MRAKYHYLSMSDLDGKPTGWLKTEGHKYDHEGELYADVAAFLTTLGPERVISVNVLRAPDMFTHVIIWYWERPNA